MAFDLRIAGIKGVANIAQRMSRANYQDIEIFRDGLRTETNRAMRKTAMDMLIYFQQEHRRNSEKAREQLFKLIGAD